MNFQTLALQTRKYKYVSFDLFNTLMFRTVNSPEEIFELVQQKYNQKGDKIFLFKFSRMQAEEKARKKNQYREVTIDMIYECLRMNQSKKAKLKTIEKDIEVNTCIPNNIMIDFLDMCKKRGQSIVITTDMYLDQLTIERILENIGVKFDKLFISSEINRTKLSGELFLYLLNKLGCKKTEICHIGDDLKTDIESSKQCGIHSFERLIHKSDTIFYRTIHYDSNGKHLQEFLKKSIQDKNDSGPECRIGYSIVGPFIYSFCKWLRENSLRIRADKMAFIAREGYLIKRIYEILYPEQAEQCVYLKLNKNMVRLPALYLTPTIKQFLKTIPYRKVYSWNEIFDLLFIEDKHKIIELLKLNNEDTQKKEISRAFMQSQEFEDYFCVIIEYLKPQLYNQYKLFVKYLSEIGCIQGKVLLVNNSINGNVQIILEEICKRQKVYIDFCGVQFIASKECKKRLNGKCIAFFDNYKIGLYEKTIFDKYSIIFEHMLFEPSGTAKYCVEKDGKMDVICDEEGMESMNYHTVNRIQEFAIKFAERYKDINLDITRSAINNYFSFLLKPYYKDAVIIGDLYDKDYNGSSKIICSSVDVDHCDYHAIEHVVENYESVKWPYAYFSINGVSDRYINRYTLGKKVKLYLKCIKNQVV